MEHSTNELRKLSGLLKGLKVNKSSARRYYVSRGGASPEASKRAEELRTYVFREVDTLTSLEEQFILSLAIIELGSLGWRNHMSWLAKSDAKVLRYLLVGSEGVGPRS